MSHDASDLDPAAWPVLMRSAQDGDRDAYRRLLIAIAPFLRATAARFSREPQDIEDAVQDILMTVHAIRHTYDPSRPFKPWLAAVAHNRLVDRLRGKRRILSREVSLGPEHENYAAVEMNASAAAWDGRALRCAIGLLPQGQRQAIELTKLRELSLKEASATSGLSIAALKVATHRGLMKLRSLLREKESA